MGESACGRSPSRSALLKLRLSLKRIVPLPPPLTIRKAVRYATGKLISLPLRRHDFRHSTYLAAFPSSTSRLHRYVRTVPIAELREQTEQIAALVQHYLVHQFDLLGSGWVQVRHGMRCQGLEGSRYESGSSVEVDTSGRWLERRINAANLPEAQRIWGLVDSDYLPIDWQLDFKSGYRWAEGTWYRDVPYAHRRGVDVKVPWELARMQHLPQLAWAHALAAAGEPSFISPEVHLREFRNQVIDFIATNPPRFGVNWRSTMDVAIRAANWLVAYDLFRAQGIEFDPAFDNLFIRSLYEHGLHIVNNLEWDPVVRDNHYLSNITGLLFLSAYLPRTQEIDTWLALAVQELVQEVAAQFTTDGANFEASTSYHRLSAELVVYGTSLALGLPATKQAALTSYDHRLHACRPKLNPAPISLYPSPGTNHPTPFPAWYVERLGKMAEFAWHVTQPDWHIAQIGDNDSGRFLKLQPVHQRVRVRDHAAHTNMSESSVIADEAVDWQEDVLDHRHLVAAINGLFGRADLDAFAGEGWVERGLVHQLADEVWLPSYRHEDEPTAAEIVRLRIAGDHLPAMAAADSGPGNDWYLPTMPESRIGLRQGLALSAYPDFGLYLYRSTRISLAVRCGSVGQHGNGGHAHNDQLSFVLHVDGIPIIVDPGTYLYTPAPDQRNRFRSTAMHTTLFLDRMEQNCWWPGVKGLFRLPEQSRAQVVTFDEQQFEGIHTGYGETHRRGIRLYPDRICARDEYYANEERTLAFQIAPTVRVSPMPGSSGVNLQRGAVNLQLGGGPGEWSVAPSAYSPGYGVMIDASVVLLRSSAKRLEWSLQITG